MDLEKVVDLFTATMEVCVHDFYVQLVQQLPTEFKYSS